MHYHTITLSEKQIDTIISALKFDYKHTKETFGALPLGVEMRGEIRSAYDAINSQIGNHDEAEAS